MIWKWSQRLKSQQGQVQGCQKLSAVSEPGPTRDQFLSARHLPGSQPSAYDRVSFWPFLARASPASVTSPPPPTTAFPRAGSTCVRSRSKAPCHRRQPPRRRAATRRQWARAGQWGSARCADDQLQHLQARKPQLPASHPSCEYHPLNRPFPPASSAFPVERVGRSSHGRCRPQYRQPCSREPISSELPAVIIAEPHQWIQW